MCSNAPCYDDSMGGSKSLPGVQWFHCSEGLSGKQPVLPCVFGASYPSLLEQGQALIPLAFRNLFLYFLVPFIYLSLEAALLSFALVCLLKHFAYPGQVCKALTVPPEAELAWRCSRES